MRQQLNRQKNSVQNRSVDSSRRPGHYNPYTCQYVPAPKPSTNSLGEESWNSSSSADTQPQRSIQEKELEEDDMKLVDDEWLIIGDEDQYLDDDDDQWDMESLRNENDDDVSLIDSDWSNFDSPNGHTADTHQLDEGASHFATTAALSSHAQRSNAQSNATGTSQLKYVPSKSMITAKALLATNRRSQPQNNLRQESQEARNQPPGVASSLTQDGPVFRKLQNCERVIPSAALIMDSPQPGSVVRKRSGQSIYKAPGSKPSDTR